MPSSVPHRLAGAGGVASHSTLRGVVLRYGCDAMSDIRNVDVRRHGTLWIVKSGKSVFASSFDTEGWTITSSPFFQLTGVVTRYLSPICRAISVDALSAHHPQGINSPRRNIQSTTLRAKR